MKIKSLSELAQAWKDKKITDLEAKEIFGTLLFLFYYFHSNFLLLFGTISFIISTISFLFELNLNSSDSV